MLGKIAYDRRCEPEDANLTLMMTFIEHVLEPHRLLLVWQGPEGSSRTRHTVAELLCAPDGATRLRYLEGTKSLEQAQEDGFASFPAFRKLGREYNQGVVETFMRRLPPRSRGDYAQYLERFRLRPGTKISDFALLSYTGAKLPSDGFSILNPLSDLTAPGEVLLEVAGFRHTSELSLEAISVGMRAALKPESDNPHDPNAVVIRINGKKIGHVPRPQAAAIGDWLRNERPLQAHVERINGTQERPLVFLFARFGVADAATPETAPGHMGVLQTA